MEVNYQERNFTPVSENLIRQVEEHSDLCDITVRHGQWEKKFHRCVLSASPFFDNVFRAKSNFIEWATRVVDLKLETTTEEVEMALLFLYGRNPNLSFDNIGGILELAEFFIIENLKSYCIFWLQNQTLTNENCLFVLQLSTKYNFQLKDLDTYIESNLHEVFRNKDATTISRESLEYFFTDKKFTYVSMDEKIEFLAAWVTHNQSESEEYIRSLFNKIDTEEISNRTIERVKNLSPFNKVINFEAVIHRETNENNRQNVLIISDRENYFDLFNFHKNRWYWLKDRMHEFRYTYMHEENSGITGVQNSSPEIYFYQEENGFSEPCVVNINLNTDVMETYYFRFPDEEISETELRNVRLRNDIIIGTARKSGYFFKKLKVQNTCMQTSVEPTQQPGSSFLQLLQVDKIPVGANVTLSNNGANLPVPPVIDNDQSLSNLSEYRGLTCMPIITSEEDYPLRRNDLDIYFSEPVEYTDLYIGYISTGEHIRLFPIFSLRNLDISDACIGSNSIAALLTESGKVVLFDMTVFKIEIVEIIPDANYRINETDDGFLIYNNALCYCLSGVSGQSLLEKYVLTKFDFEKNKGWVVQYNFSNGMWLSVSYKSSMADDIRMQFISHEKILQSQFQNVTWESISLPEDVNIRKNIQKNKKLFVIPISTSKLRCPTACPHCTFKQKSVPLMSDDSSSNSYEDEYLD
ncbi:uncharacterized protein LOC132741907 [Ruditapes philippinarum]|uniref:uncharacterized protein LOC132741907 n=1 Tax=Ruditapes philippinarum TaxID=129788 RepID=UPI00295A682A|nr:uncharacterized protein LOC132741907 [Ruditapes philippinarum]